MITHLLLDADHVLINKPALWSKVYAERRGIDPAIFEATVTPFFTGPFQDCLVGRADLKQIIQPWLERWPATGTVDEFLAEWFQAEHFIDSELLEEIKRLRDGGLKIYVATNQERYRTEYLLEQMGFARQFDGMLASYDLEAKKPEPAFFDAALGRIGNPSKDQVLFWDDDPENVTAAQSFGIQAERYETLEQFKRVTAGYSLPK